MAPEAFQAAVLAALAEIAGELRRLNAAIAATQAGSEAETDSPAVAPPTQARPGKAGRKS